MMIWNKKSKGVIIIKFVWYNQAKFCDEDPDDDEFFCCMVDRQKAFSFISSRDHCQRSSPSRISNTLRVGFEPAQSLSSGLVESRFAVVITTTPRRYVCYTCHFTENLFFFFSRRPEKMVFPKITCWNMIYLVLSGEMIFFFSKIWSYPIDGKWEMIFLKKYK